MLFGLARHSPYFCLRFGIYLGITSIIAPFWNIQLRRSKAKGVDWFTASTYFIYRLLLYPFTFISVCNTLFKYLPVCKEKPQFKELEDTVLDRESLIRIYREFNEEAITNCHKDNADALILDSAPFDDTDHDKGSISVVVEDDFERVINIA